MWIFSNSFENFWKNGEKVTPGFENFWKTGDKGTPFFENFPKEIHRIADFGSVSYRSPHQNPLFSPSVPPQHQFLTKNIKNKEELEKFFENFVKKIRIYTKCKLYTPPALFYSFFYFLPFFVDFLETKFYAFFCRLVLGKKFSKIHL